MAESPETRAGVPETPPTPVPPKPLAENAVLKFVQQPRIMLLLLAVWEIIGALSEFFTSSGLFVNLHGGELDGALGGRVLGWEQIPLAALYIYCARDPQRYHRVFYLALLEQAVAVVANIYHWGTDDFSGESVIIPVAVAAGLGALVFLHLFQAKPAETAPPPSPAEAAGGG